LGSQNKPMSVLVTVGKILLGIILVLIAAGSGFFGYICVRAEAKKWAVGMFLITFLCLLALYGLVRL